MGRTTNITFGQVAAIADAMKAAGTRPTARAVRERIGTGSMGTIHKLLQQWAGKVAEADEEDDSPELPSSIASTLMDFVSTQVAEACEPLNEELQAAKDAANQIAEDNERMHLAFDEQGRELVNMLEKYAASNATLDQTRAVLADHESEVFKLRAQVSELLLELDRSKRQTEMLANLQPDLAKAQQHLAEARNGREDAQRDAAVLGAQLAAKTEQANDLAERLKTCEYRADRQSEELKQANNHYQACAARLEAAAREIESLKAEKAKTPTKPKPAKTLQTKSKESIPADDQDRNVFPTTIDR